MTDYLMKLPEMLKVVQNEFERLSSGEKNYTHLKIKNIHTNPNYNNRRMLANKANGEVRTEKAMFKIKSAIEYLEYKNIATSLKNVTKYLKGETDRSTVKKYYRSCASNHRIISH